MEIAGSGPKRSHMLPRKSALHPTSQEILMTKTVNLLSQETGFAQLRDSILLSCINKDYQNAVAQLIELKKFSNQVNKDDPEFNEYKCRILETELDIAEISNQPFSGMLLILKEITTSKYFSNSRREEILIRGFDRLLEKLDNQQK